MGFAAFLPLILLVVIAVRVGFGLILMGRRSRELPELCIGAGLLSITLLGLPCAALGRLPGNVGTAPGTTLFALGIGFTVVGVALLYVFTWDVFHARRGLGTVLLVAGVVALVVSGSGIVSAGWGLDDLAEIVPRMRPWALGLVGSLAAAFVWSGVASLVFHRRYRRRLVLGMADPLVVNRFFVWGVAGLMVGCQCAAIMAFLQAGVVIMRDPAALAVISVIGSFTSVAWWLTFLPPARYRALVLGRAARRAAADSPTLRSPR